LRVNKARSRLLFAFVFFSIGTHPLYAQYHDILHY
jgi:hypothetical protein